MRVGLGQRIVQLHVTATCNLRCVHCYSSSGPAARVTISLASARAALSDVCSMGYDVVAFSGGEPLVYPALPQLLEHAKGLGMRTLVTTNGSLLPSRLQYLRGLIDVLAISVDGPPEIHNRIRASARAFDDVLRGLDATAAAGQPFGIIHALSRRTWEHLPWLADLASERGAALLQLHPLERTGRAETELLPDEAPDDELLARAYLVVAALRVAHPGLSVQFDVFDRHDIACMPELVYAAPFEDSAEDASPAADLLGIMVVEPDGTVVPVSYGMSRALAVCNVNRTRVVDAWSAYRAGGYGRFRTLCRDVWKEAIADTSLPLFNWHEMIVARSLAQNA